MTSYKGEEEEGGGGVGVGWWGANKSDVIVEGFVTS